MQVTETPTEIDVTLLEQSLSGRSRRKKQEAL